MTEEYRRESEILGTMAINTMGPLAKWFYRKGTTEVLEHGACESLSYSVAESGFWRSWNMTYQEVENFLRACAIGTIINNAMKDFLGQGRSIEWVQNQVRNGYYEEYLELQEEDLGQKEWAMLTAAFRHALGVEGIEA